eukprot:TRINITY_DN63636_c0_g1_i1.p1 TRINITY_DN63636_c0_g1~~TRINITY_DN63636_c0_g1_i1.p1  ORF type:complete len:221 (+),score=46.58 TRINITY_DN63636_c0_g1_i1:134-796(+)
MIRRPPRSTLSSSSAASDVYKRQDGYEGNFVFLFVGTERAVLFDTGPAPLPEFKAAIGELAARVTDPSELELVVAHTHGHGDHVAGDCLWEDGDTGGFKTVRVVGPDQQAVCAAFGLVDWPEGAASVDLGSGRALGVFPLPGHEPSHIAVYDRDGSKVLITGDFLYPGRIYVHDDLMFVESVRRLEAFTRQHQAEISMVLGCHIEMTSQPGVEYLSLIHI